MPWTLDIRGCPRVAEDNLTCMACGESHAEGHVRVGGGPSDGRMLMVVCPACGSPDDNARKIKDVLSVMMAMGQITRDGGPGPNPTYVMHGDHFDILDHQD